MFDLARSVEVLEMNLQRTLSRIKSRARSAVQRMQGRKFVHLLHVGKTGGSAIKHTISKNCSESPYVICLHTHQTRLRDVPKGDGVVFFLRDPISRFISGFYSRQRQGQPRYLSPWSPGERNAFEEFDTANKLAIAISSSDDGTRKRAHEAMRSIEHVRDSYWKWFDNEDYFRSRLSDVFFIGFQERLEEEFEILKSKLGLPESVKLPTDDIDAHRNPTGIDKTLAAEAIANLKEWYQHDYEFIAMCEAVIHERPDLRDSRPTMRST